MGIWNLLISDQGLGIEYRKKGIFGFGTYKSKNMSYNVL